MVQEHPLSPPAPSGVLELTGTGSWELIVKFSGIVLVAWNHGGNIYTMETSKRYKSPPTPLFFLHREKFLNTNPHTTTYVYIHTHLVMYR